jgi:flagella basal body P-ring formation protein FlgA
MAERLAVAPVGRRNSESRSTAGLAERSTATKTAAPSTPKRSFRLPEVVLGVLLVAGCALGAVLWQRHADTTRTIVVARRAIARGEVITAADLRGAQIAGETAAMVAASEASSLLGQVALVDIAESSPMTASIVTDERSLAADEALTSMALEPGQVPPDLAAGDHVRVVTTASETSGKVITVMLEADAVVWAVDTAQDGISTIVTVRGPLSLATDVASAASLRLARVEG